MLRALVFLTITCFSISVSAKRAPPVNIPALNYQQHLYSVEVIRDEQGAIGLLNCRKVGQRLPVWRTILYQYKYHPKEETDVQDIYFRSMKLEHDTLVVMDEKGRSYRVNAQTGLLPKPYLISGFDDVLRQAENTGLFRAALKILKADKTFAGMRELYTLMSNQEEQAPHFVLVSAIATWFNRRITDFLTANRYPSFELRLRNWITQWPIEKFKTDEVEKIINDRPGRQFTVIFDNSEASLTMARDFAVRFAPQLSAIYLRWVVDRPVPQSAVPFVTAFDIALNELRLSHFNSKEVMVVGYALLDEKRGENVIPEYAHCPKEYNPCENVGTDLLKVCEAVKERIQKICRARK